MLKVLKENNAESFYNTRMSNCLQKVIGFQFNFYTSNVKNSLILSKGEVMTQLSYKSANELAKMV